MNLDSVFAGEPVDSGTSLAQVRKKGVEDIEKAYLKELLANNHGRVGTSADIAGITSRHLHKLMVKYGLKKEAFR
jgi:DNA-binding NtrC family response regulator